jgi:hypothetical protein
MTVELKLNIAKAIKSFTKDDLFINSLNLFDALGYDTSRQNPLENPTYSCFKESFIDNNEKKFIEVKAKTETWKSVHLLFQLTQAELTNQGFLFDLKQVDKSIIETYLFFAIELESNNYSRSIYSDITREINKLFPMPVMVLFKNGNFLTLSIINRRLNKRDENKDVLEKITLIKDIDILDPHRGHIEILFDLCFQELYNKFQFDSFVTLHNAWQKVLDANELNKKFYQELANWYFWAVTKVEFPDDIKFNPNHIKDRQIRNSTNTIRLITRLIFTWFLREKGLIPDALFNEKKITQLLNGTDKSDSIFYKAILQNLFFATLNTPMNVDQPGSRRFVNGQHLVHTFYRYERFFQNPSKALKLFENIPFLNGGLFECLDRKGNDDEPIRIDCFSENPKNEKRLIVPDELFFAETTQIDLNDIYQTTNRKYKVRGIINILNSYKFTITENTPIEEEVALDPELLGKVFENLLASYNPETETTARKQTGSFYTPREIVNYMVDEGLIAYFKTYLTENYKKGRQEEDFEEQIRDLLRYSDKDHEFNQDQIKILVEAIDNFKVLDPACGSGAFPMGVLHKLVFVLGKLDENNTYWRELQKVKAIKETEETFNLGNRAEREERLKDINDTFENNNDDYGRKLYLIENGIYGVDIQPIAVQIAKLRFFISLIVDQQINTKIENLGIRPLPNLETKFVAANSLIGLEKDNNNLFTNPEIDKKKAELKQVRHSHFKARTSKTKEKCRQRDRELRSELANLLVDDHNLQPEAAKMVADWNPYDQNTFAQFFDIEWMFGLTSGFDLVITNPPFIVSKGGRYTGINFSNELIKYLRQNYKTAEQQFNTYTLFIELAKKLLTKYGISYFIVPNTFLANEYSFKLREFLTSECSVYELFNTGLVFEAASVETVVLGYGIHHSDFIKVRYNSEFFSFLNTNEIISLTEDKKFLIKLNPGVLSIIQRMNKYPKLRKFAKVWRGLTTGNDKKYISYTQKTNRHKPLITGGEIEKFVLHPIKKYIEYIPTELDRPRDERIFVLNEKLISKFVGSNLTFAYDSNKYYVLNSGCITEVINNSVSIKYLLALLNSRILNFYFTNVFSDYRDTFPIMKSGNIESLPLPEIQENTQQKFCAIVDWIIFLKGNNKDYTFFERLIDGMAYELFLSEEMLSAGCDILKYLNDLPSIKEEWTEDLKLKTIETIYSILSSPDHYVSKAIHFMDTVDEIAIIEEKKI